MIEVFGLVMRWENLGMMAAGMMGGMILLSFFMRGWKGEDMIFMILVGCFTMVIGIMFFFIQLEIGMWGEPGFHKLGWIGWMRALSLFSSGALFGFPVAISAVFIKMWKGRKAGNVV